MSRTLVAALAVLVIAAAGYFWYAAQPTDTGEGPGAPLVNVMVPQLTAAQQVGKDAFDTYCVACHGENAAGQDGVAPPLVHIIYEPNHHADISFLLAAQTGVRSHHWPFGNMPPVEGITPAEVDSIVAYIRALQRANGIE